MIKKSILSRALIHVFEILPGILNCTLKNYWDPILSAVWYLRLSMTVIIYF